MKQPGDGPRGRALRPYFAAAHPRARAAKIALLDMSDPTSQTAARIWIAPGCIVCNLCEDTCPEVFNVHDDTCTIRPAADRYIAEHHERVVQAAQECPVDVIRIRGHNEPEAR